jgi:baculoviral IAP repeat-containing protein 6
MWRMTEEVGVFGDGDMKDEAGRYRHHYAQNINETAGSFSKVKMQRLTQECDMLANSLPISRASSIFVRTDEDRLDVMKALIVGPRETPYGGGCFIFGLFSCFMNARVAQHWTNVTRL